MREILLLSSFNGEKKKTMNTQYAKTAQITFTGPLAIISHMLTVLKMIDSPAHLKYNDTPAFLVFGK